MCVKENGEIYTTELSQYSFHLSKKVGFKFHFHQLRHTHATMLIDAGISPKAVQYRLGHKDIATTMNIYVELTQKMNSDISNKVEDFSKGIVINEKNVDKMWTTF